MTDQPDLRQRLADGIADALRRAAHHCDGQCGTEEAACVAAHPVQITAWTFDVVSGVDGPIDDLARVAADAVLAVVQPELETAWKHARHLEAQLSKDQAERDRFAAGVPLVCCDERHAAKVRGLEAERDRLAYRCESKTEAIRALNADCESLDRERQQAAAEGERLAATIQALTEAVILWRDRPGGDIGLAIALSGILDAEQPDPPAATAMVRVLRVLDAWSRRLCASQTRELLVDVQAALDASAPAGICEVPHETVEEEDACEERRTRATPCSQPNPCEDGEPCDTHATEQAHASGEHGYCDITCEAAMPSDQMRNFIIAKGYPGTAGALNELLRRAAAGTSRPAAPAEPACPGHTECARCDVTDPCPCCGLRYVAGEWRPAGSGRHESATARSGETGSDLNAPAAKETL